MQGVLAGSSEGAFVVFFFGGCVCECVFFLKKGNYCMYFSD